MGEINGMEQQLKASVRERNQSDRQSFAQPVRRESILPFTERPSEEKKLPTQSAPKGQIPAAELFSIFTANIIREDVIFIR